MTQELAEFAAYVSPLTDKEHATIGRIAVLWGQLEYYVEECVEKISPFSATEEKFFKISSMRISEKVRLLRSFSEREPDHETRALLLEFCDEIEATRDARNDIFHGIWGWRAFNRTQEMIPAARKSRNLKQPFRYDRLPKIERQLCRAARLGHRLTSRYFGFQEHVRSCRFVHHDADVEQWMEKWCEEFPILKDEMVAMPVEGQLTRFSKMLPKKVT